MPTPGERFDRMSDGQAYKPESRGLDPRKVVVEPGWNVRDMNSPDTLDHIRTLKLSILARGVDEAIGVRYDKVTGVATLVDGQCRLTACRELWNEGHKVYVPAIRVTGDEAELTAHSLTSNAGHPLTQWEIGAGCRRLLKYGWTPSQIAQHICKPVRYVNEAIALAVVPVEAKALMASGSVTPSRVLQEIKEKGDAAVPALKEAVAKAKAAPQTAAASPAKGKAAKAKPLARKKAPNPAERFIEMADELAHMVADEAQSWDKVLAFAKKYIKLRSAK
jgi:ParB-like chromosome segregation protein Spo0J